MSALVTWQILVKKGYRVSKRASKRRWKLKHLDMEVADDVAELKGDADRKAYVPWSLSVECCLRTEGVMQHDSLASSCQCVQSRLRGLHAGIRRGLGPSLTNPAVQRYSNSHLSYLKRALRILNGTECCVPGYIYIDR
jgi:hypothetical protein